MGTHIIAVSMDGNGQPIKLFTTNRWVTDETWYKAADMLEMLDQFEIDHTFPSWATNRWLTAIFVLFRPQIIQMILERDQELANWVRKADEGEDVFEDRELEVISETKISVTRQIKSIKRVLDRRRA